MALTRAKTTETPVNTEAQADPTLTQVIDKDEVNAALEEARNEQAAADKAAEDKAKADAEAKGQQEAADKAEADKALAAKQAEDEAAANASAEPEPKPEAKPEIEPEMINQGVAVRNESTAVTAAPGAVGGAMAQFKDEMAAEGYEGMNLTGMSFDRVKLHEAQFLLGSEDTKLGEKIHVRVMSTRSIYVVRQHAGQKAEMFYSYDPAGKTKSDGSSAAEVLAEWLEEGYGTQEDPLQIKEYIEGMAQLVLRDDEYNDHIVSLSIPPASKDRLAGAFAVGRQRLRCGPQNLIIECNVGAKVGSGDEAFRPWVFKAHSVAQD